MTLSWFIFFSRLSRTPLKVYNSKGMKFTTYIYRAFVIYSTFRFLQVHRSVVSFYVCNLILNVFYKILSLVVFKSLSIIYLFCWKVDDKIVLIRYGFFELYHHRMMSYHLYIIGVDNNLISIAARGPKAVKLVRTKMLLIKCYGLSSQFSLEYSITFNYF